jgi:mitochondrial import receptor subunit TOM40
MADTLSPPSFLTDNAVVATVKDAYTSFSDRRAALGLTNPGTTDNIAREVQKEVLLSNFMFTGLRAELTKTFGLMNPIFRLSHAFSMGSQGVMPPYALSAMYGSPKVGEALWSGLYSLSLKLRGISTGVYARQPGQRWLAHRGR